MRSETYAPLVSLSIGLKLLFVWWTCKHLIFFCLQLLDNVQSNKVLRHSCFKQRNKQLHNGAYTEGIKKWNFLENYCVNTIRMILPPHFLTNSIKHIFKSKLWWFVTTNRCSSENWPQIFGWVWLVTALSPSYTFLTCSALRGLTERAWNGN